MPSRWQREFTCDVCGRRGPGLAGRLLTRGRYGWATTWSVCNDCLDVLFTVRGSMYLRAGPDKAPEIRWPAGRWAL